MTVQKILLVDDNNGQRVTMEGILKQSGYDVVSATCGNDAIALSGENAFAAALLDIKMPDLTGIDVLRVLKEKQPDISIIMMTGHAEANYAIDALNNGAAAYLMKPAKIDQVKRLLDRALEHKRLVSENRAMSTALRDLNQQLEEKVLARTRQLETAHALTLRFYGELKKNFESTLEVLSIAIDQRDPLTSSHSFRVTQYALEIARAMGFHDHDLEKLRYAGLLHDVGKIDIACELLCKEGSLTAPEYKKIQSHAEKSYDLLSKFRFKNDLADIPLIASSHHERYDGAGYPRHLKEEDIPLLSRVLSVADVFDAITSKRHYRTAMSIPNALSVMRREAGGHFDPKCVDALFRVTVGAFIKIHMTEEIETLDAIDIAEMERYDLSGLHNAFGPDPSPQEQDLIRRITRYYAGPASDAEPQT